MSDAPLHALVSRLREAVRPPEVNGLGDAELLQRWSASRDEAAFELLVWRHGPLVLSVCRRLLRHQQDVEDAFQATFLVLVKKAAGIRGGQAVASWLHTVATRIALHARARRRQDEPVPEELPARPAEPPGAGELQAVLDEEVGRLPEKYRAPFVLCYFEGRTNEEAARELGRPLGTILSRLARARQRLRDRLTRRGVTPAVLTPVLSQMVPCGLVGTTMKAATAFAVGRAAGGGAVAPAVVALTEGVLQAMLIAKVKAASAALVAVAVLCAGGGVGYRTVVASASGPVTAARAGADLPRRAADTQDDARRERDELRKQLAEANERIKALEKQVTDLLQRDRSKGAPKSPKEGSDPFTGRAVDTEPRSNWRTLRDPLNLDPKILQARVAEKEAELTVARAALDQAKRAHERTQRLANSAAVSQEVVDEPRTKLAVAEAQYRVQEARLREAKVLLEQARSLVAPAPRPGSSDARRQVPLEQRLDELERMLRQVQNALQEMRREITPVRPRKS